MNPSKSYIYTPQYKYMKNPSKLQNHMHKLLDEVSEHDRRIILAAKPKILSHVLLSGSVREKVFKNIIEAERYLKCENTWKRVNSRRTRYKKIQTYFCKRRKCKACVYLRFNDNSEKVLLSRGTSHTHEFKYKPINEIVKSTKIIYKTDSNVNRNIHPNRNDTEIKQDGITCGIHDEIVYDKKFPTINRASQYMEEAKTWDLVSTTLAENTTTTVHYYRCNLVSNTGVSCPVKKWIFYELPNVVLLYRNTVRHNHDSLDQIFLNEICIEVFYDNKEIFDTFEMWLSSIDQIPNDYHTVYCVDYLLDRDLQTLRFFLSNRQLLKSALDSRSIHVTSLSSLQWKNFEVILVGTTDLEHKFHHFGVAVCSAKTASDYEFIFSSIQKGVSECYPNTNFKIYSLLSDCNPAVQNAFKFVYGCEAKTVTCLNDFSFKIDTLFEKEKAIDITMDIVNLQKLPSTDLFNVGVQLFLQKWEIKLIEQFKTQWLDKNCNWYEGYSYFIPSKNKAVSREYENFRKSYLYEKLDSVPTLMNKLFLALKTWSDSYSNGYEYAKYPQAPITVFQEACSWLRKRKHIKTDKTDTETFYYFKSELSLARFDQDILELFRSQEVSTLDQFFAARLNFIEVRKDHQNVITCECLTFFKHFVCQHSIGVGYLLNLYKIPLSVIPNPSEIPYYLKLN